MAIKRGVDFYVKGYTTVSIGYIIRQNRGFVNEQG